MHVSLRLCCSSVKQVLHGYMSSFTCSKWLPEELTFDRHTIVGFAWSGFGTETSFLPSARDTKFRIELQLLRAMLTGGVPCRMPSGLFHDPKDALQINRLQ